METCHDNQSEILITVFVLICIAFISGMEVPLDDSISHINHCYGNSVTMAIRVKMSITHLFSVVSSSYLVLSFPETIGFSNIPYYYDNL